MFATYLSQKNKLPPVPASLPDGSPWPRISVVTPTYNQGSFIEDTIRSVLEQDYPNLEYIVVDGGSTDSTPAVLDKYRDRITHIIQEPDKGQSDAINKGMRLATGDILTWVNSDDLLAPGALAAVAMGFHMSNADLVAGECVVFCDGVYEYTHITSCGDGPLPAETISDLDGGWQTGQFFYQPEVMFSRALWERSGAQVREDLHFCMDVELWLRFADSGAVLHVIGSPVAYFRTHGQQKTSDRNASPNEYLPVSNAWRAQRGLAPLVRHNPPCAPPLRIAFVNDVGFEYGAGIAHRRLFRAVEQAGHEVRAFMLGQGLNDAAYAAQERKTLQQLAGFKPDLVVCGNIHGAKADASLLTRLTERWPTIFCAHDLWLLSGHCPHPSFWQCDKARSGCDATCPSPDTYPALAPNRIFRAWKDKREILHSKCLQVFCNSRWTLASFEDCVAGEHHPFEKIQLGFEESVFHPMDAAEARKSLGIAPEAFVVLLPMVNFDDPYKGSGPGLEALSAWGIPGLQIICFGVVTDELKARYPLLRAMGYLHDARTIARVYAASDVVVSFSKAETLGQTLLEASLCGKPVLAYGVTGLTDAVTHGVSGFLTEPHPGAVVDKLKELHSDAVLRACLGAWGAIHSRNTRSLTAAYRSFYLALQKSGLLPPERLNRHIALRKLPVEQLLQNDCSMARTVHSARKHLLRSCKMGLKKVCPPPVWRLLKKAYRILR